jgi:hypothetical protein
VTATNEVNFVVNCEDLGLGGGGLLLPQLVQRSLLARFVQTKMISLLSVKI